MSKLKSYKATISIPGFGKLEGQWEPDKSEQKAAWEMYVELMTRISVVELKSGDGLLREALDSLYSLFETTREILKKYGPKIARSKSSNDLCFGKVAVIILNEGIRPVLTKWHPLLLDYESTREEQQSRVEHENSWKMNDELRKELNKVRYMLFCYAKLLSEVAGVDSLETLKKE